MPAWLISSRWQRAFEPLLSAGRHRQSIVRGRKRGASPYRNHFAGSQQVVSIALLAAR
jgi:hypothetical protein